MLDIKTNEKRGKKNKTKKKNLILKTTMSEKWIRKNNDAICS